MKNRIHGEVFSLYFLLQDIPPTIYLFDLFCKKYQKSENPGHMRPGPLKSYLPREETGPAMSRPPSSDLVHAALRNSILCAEKGRERALDMASTSPKFKCLF
jgi:hypothetical protein